MVAGCFAVILLCTGLDEKLLVFKGAVGSHLDC